MLGLIGALAGAGGGIASAFMGASAQDSANAWNNYFNERNIRAQQKQQREAREFADSVLNDQKLGGTDALGNRTYFDDEEGWITQLSDEQQSLYDYFFKQELPELRELFGRQAEHSRENSDQADALLREFQRVRKQSPQEAESQLYLAATRGAADAASDVSEAALRHATRTGNSNISNIIGQIGRQSMQQRADAALNAKMQSEDYVNQKYAQERGGVASLYQQFLANAMSGISPSYDPTGIAQDAGRNLGLFANAQAQGNSQAFNARSAPAPQYGNIQPNMAFANAAASIGGSLNGLGSRAQGMVDKNNANDLMRMYITQGGQNNMERGGLYGAIARNLGNSGAMR